MHNEDISDWLATAGAEKAESITTLVREPVADVVEIGCGTGAVLTALEDAGFATNLWGCEPSTELFDQIPLERIARLRGVENTTFEHAFPGRTFDLAILSHVVEHLLAPAKVINQALTRARRVVVEVPIEAGPGGYARMTAKRALGHDPLANPAGHVQFFSRRTARKLVEFSGGRVVAERGYFPRGPYSALRPTPSRRLVLAVADHAAPVAQRYYEHFAMLVEPAEVTDWDHHYARPE